MEELEGGVALATEEFMTIGVFSRRTWLSPKALRLYERMGVLSPAIVDPATGYRRYTNDQLSDARLIRSLRQIDMPLDRIGELIRVSDAERAAILAEYWRSVEREIARQRFLSHHLQSLLTPHEGKPMFEVHVRDTDEVVVVTEQRYVAAAELTGWIQEALSRQHEAIGPHAQIAASFVIYHGEVTEDSDGPVEVCTPIPAEMVATASIPTRVETAHREAYVTLTRPQLEYPQILTAYRTVEEWAALHGRTLSGPAREIYFGDFSQDTMGVADVAFPIAAGTAI